MSGATAATQALQQAAADCYRSAFEAGSAFARQHTAVVKAADIVETMQAMIELVIAAEALHTASDASVKALRAALAEQMEATGAASVATEHHKASLAKQPAFLSIADEELIPRDFYIQPPPQLDKRALKSALSDGIQIAGVSLAIPNQMSLRIAARKETP
ncbi:MAG TPA: siphovirus Gp157 family protein [Steroidobacteraceae bacterium]|jgi:hypothetical protein